MRIIRIAGPPSRRGFTLTELAIVLLIISIVLGAIWVVVEHVWDNYRVYRADQQVVKVVQNIREYYMNAQQLPASGGNKDITAILDGLNLFPYEMRRIPTAGPGLTPIDNPFNDNLKNGAAPANGSFHVTAVGCPGGSGTTVCFRLRVMGLTQTPCIKLLTLVPVDDTELGITQVGVQDMASAVAKPTIPVSISTAEGWCNQAGDTNEVDWDFKLRN